MSAAFPSTASEARAAMQARYGTAPLSGAARDEANRRYGLLLLAIDRDCGGFLGMSDCEFSRDPRPAALGITVEDRAWSDRSYAAWREMQ